MFYKCCRNGSEVKYYGDGVKLCYGDTFLVRGSRSVVVAFHRCHISGAACRHVPVAQRANLWCTLV